MVPLVLNVDMTVGDVVILVSFDIGTVVVPAMVLAFDGGIVNLLDDIVLGDEVLLVLDCAVVLLAATDFDSVVLSVESMVRVSSIVVLGDVVAEGSIFPDLMVLVVDDQLVFVTEPSPIECVTEFFFKKV